MPIEALTKSQLETRPSSAGHPEYVAFLRSARLGSGGRLDVKKEGMSRQLIKNRLKIAAAASGREIAFLRSSRETVIFQVVA